MLQYHGYIGRCGAKGCRATHYAERPDGWRHCATQNPVQWKQVIGVEKPEIKCGPKCVSAVGPACDCSCAGRNHGKGWAA